MWFLFAEIILSWWYSWQSHPIIIGNALERMICIICAFGFWNILFIVPERFVSVGMFDTGSDYRLLEYSRMTCSSICNTFFVPLFASSSFFSSPFHYFSLFFFHLAYTEYYLQNIGGRGNKIPNPWSAGNCDNGCYSIASRHSELLLQTNHRKNYILPILVLPNCVDWEFASCNVTWTLNISWPGQAGEQA